MNSVASVVASTLLWACISTLVALGPSLLIAYQLAKREFWGKNAVSALVSLPLVLPPTAVGYLLLTLLADDGPLGRRALGVDLDLLLNWKGVVVACSVMSMPLMVRTARVSFEAVNPRLETMARTLGYGRIRTFATVTLPLAYRGLIAAAVLGLTRAMGEFGASVVLAGNIPGRTQTLSSAIYSAQQAGNEGRANALLLVALTVGFLAVFLTEWLSRPSSNSASGKGAR
ncbi:molybdate ABC transporter permease subunit [Pelagicoccus sp. SDUM812003]|uniref:molybdate ABC transporter permease subunit n=1 Tax=Pelagicoccus sp. SDUM812003 TaxID=3041267 RepID=UPI00280CB192|nr:molybdate ABC transporter permease subunit [Pelagicoccus sp. SDUM812003]MDQ8202630.1 molybdate ABC transporter permease subunit [Pelagicoccus sp. SDUM812003]